MSNTPVQCCRCKNKHLHSERISKPSKPSGGIGMSDLVCPKCNGKSFFDLTPKVAWCWASGLIEVGDAMPPDECDGSGAIQIATGPKYALYLSLLYKARLSRGLAAGAGAGEVLVPGVPEATTLAEKAVALSNWLNWCAKANGKKHANGVVFAKEGEPL